MTGIDITQALPDFQGGQSVLSTSGGSYGENPFLSLLTAQLQNQTPLQPVDNDSFTQQLATYSSMEEQKELNDNLLNLLDFQGLLARLQGLSEGSNLLGKEVTWFEGNLEKSGTVDSVFVDESGDVRLKVGEQAIDLRQVAAIGNSAADA